MPDTETPIKKRPGRKPVITQQRKQLILDFIIEFRRVRQISPSVAEITKGIGYSASSEGQVHTYVAQLIDEGWLHKAEGASSRSLIPTRPNELYAKITDDNLKSIKRSQRNLHILRRL